MFDERAHAAKCYVDAVQQRTAEDEGAERLKESRQTKNAGKKKKEKRRIRSGLLDTRCAAGARKTGPAK